MQTRVITILGTTASGKGALGRALAERLGGEIVSLDSMKVYRSMDIGTAKPSAAARAAVPHHLIDVVDPWEPFSAARYVELADAAVTDVHARSRPVVLIGGTMLYFNCFYKGLFAGPSADAAIRSELRERAAREGVEALHGELTRIDPVAAERIHRNDLHRIERAIEVFRLTGTPISTLQAQWETAGIRRPDWEWTLIGLRHEREHASRRINERVKRMIAAGLVAEVRRLWEDPRGLSDTARQAVGYSELIEHFEGRSSLDHALELVKVHSRHLAKHQRTWLRRIIGIRWLDLTPEDTVESALPRLAALLTEAAPARG